MYLCLHNFLCSSSGLCGSKNYPYLPHRRDFSLHPPSSPLPPPPHWGIFNPFHGGSMDIFLELHNSRPTRAKVGQALDTHSLFHSTSVIVIIALHSKIQLFIHWIAALSLNLDKVYLGPVQIKEKTTSFVLLHSITIRRENWKYTIIKRLLLLFSK